MNAPLPIEKHALIGDRRTGALVAADGTIDWWCLPDFDDHVTFGALLDPERGGHCRFGPSSNFRPSLGEQRYLDSTATPLTIWENLEFADLMSWPQRDRPPVYEKSRVILRRMRARADGAAVHFEMRPRWTFEQAPRVSGCKGGVEFRFGEHRIGLWTSFSVEIDAAGATARFELQAGDEAWAMIGLGENPAAWDAARCRELHDQTNAYWRDWVAELKTFPDVNAALQRSAITVHLLAHAPNDAVVSAPTTSLPERVGGDRNYDYRYTWVRDASLSAALMATMGHPREVARYLDWLCGLDSEVDAPLQVCYRTDGQMRLDGRTVDGVAGYRGSQPVRFGNRAAKQRQVGSLGFLADCAHIFLTTGGEWKPEFTRLIHRAADYVCGAWREPDSGVWELPEEAHYVASKVMAWVTLDRAGRIVRHLGEATNEHWEKAAAEVRAEVLEKRWSEKCRAFRQRYDADSLDAAALLIPLMDFLPPDDPRVLDTLAAIERELVVNGLVHRFDPSTTMGGEQLPIGEFEGAFLPCVFWHAHTLAKAGRCDEAEAILVKCEAISGETGLFAEEADAKNDTFLGNTPLLFAHVEYTRAVVEPNKARARESSQETRTS